MSPRFRPLAQTVVMTPDEIRIKSGIVPRAKDQSARVRQIVESRKCISADDLMVLHERIIVEHDYALLPSSIPVIISFWHGLLQVSPLSHLMGRVYDLLRCRSGGTSLYMSLSPSERSLIDAIVETQILELLDRDVAPGGDCVWFDHLLALGFYSESFTSVWSNWWGSRSHGHANTTLKFILGLLSTTSTSSLISGPELDRIRLDCLGLPCSWLPQNEKFLASTLSASLCRQRLKELEGILPEWESQFARELCERFDSDQSVDNAITQFLCLYSESS